MKRKQQSGNPAPLLRTALIDLETPPPLDAFKRLLIDPDEFRLLQYLNELSDPRQKHSNSVLRHWLLRQLQGYRHNQQRDETMHRVVSAARKSWFKRRTGARRGLKKLRERFVTLMHDFQNERRRIPETTQYTTLHTLLRQAIDKRPYHQEAYAILNAFDELEQAMDKSVIMSVFTAEGRQRTWINQAMGSLRSVMTKERSAEWLEMIGVKQDSSK